MGIATFWNGTGWSSGISHEGLVVAASRLPSLAPHGDLTGGEGVQELESVQLGPPVLDPDKILCIGLNYREHATEVALDPPVARDLPEVQELVDRRRGTDRVAGGRPRSRLRRRARSSHRRSVART